MSYCGTLSASQRAILRWLMAYPNLRIVWHPKSNWRPYWPSMWASEEARQHMVRTMDALGGSAWQTEPRWRPDGGGTPRLTTQTFHALRRRGLIRAVARRLPTPTIAEMYYWQITPDGRRAALSGRSERPKPEEDKTR